MNFHKNLLLGVAAAGLLGGTAHAAEDQDAPTNTPTAGEIVVTAQKREQAINSVGMSITAATGDVLAARGVTTPADLTRVVPGFTYTSSPYSTPVYTLRGIGLYDYSFGSAPSVAVYQDEFSIPYPTMSVGLSLDVQRVEVLKGPQGTLYGSSSTGGAINFIANKPTDTLKAGADLSYDNFGKLDASGFVSGPLSATLKGRLALRAVQGGEWQYSLSRPQDRSGSARQLIGRATLDWEPSSTVRFELTGSGYRDRSDIQLSQFVFNQINIVPRAGFIPVGGVRSNPYETVNPTLYAAYSDPASPGFDASLASRQALLSTRLSEPNTIAYLSTPAIGRGNNARVAEWSPGWPHRKDDHLVQIALRSTVDLSDKLTLTSLTSYIDQKIDNYGDNDATIASALNVRTFGGVQFFSQELRLAYDSQGVHLVGGLNYDHSDVDDTETFQTFELSVGEPLPGLRLIENSFSLFQTIENFAVFGNADVELTPNLSVQVGARWTKSDRRGAYCSFDVSPQQPFSKIFGNADVVPGFGFYDLQTAFGLNPAGHVVVRPGECAALNDEVAPTNPNYLRPGITPTVKSLNEENVSWRVGVNYKFDAGALVYANVSQGYKAGILVGLSATAQSAYQPAPQERLRSYEAGFKLPLFDRHAQLNAAAFYYDYRNKQLRASVLDPIFGLLENAINVPKSKVFGLEGELLLYPIEGLNISVSGSYLDAKVNGPFSKTAAGLTVYNRAGYHGDFQGSVLPFTPKFSAVVDAEYKWPISGGTRAFIGGTLTYQDKTIATFETATLKADDFHIPGYALLDLRAGIEAADGSWRASLWGRNVTDKVYTTTLFAGSDVLFRYTGRPLTVGASFSVRYGR